MIALSEACERNKAPILQVLRQELAQSTRLLEIGSGTGQHAVWCAPQLPHLQWQPSDVPDFLPYLQQYLDANPVANLAAALALDVGGSNWPTQACDAVFTANTLHIMSWEHVQALFRNLRSVLADQAVVCMYGPFRYDNEYTSSSNAEFDRWLKNRDPLSGIRDFEAVDECARTAGLSLRKDYPMPANNQLLVWEK
jgi:cyclopropane fatty-acyl-phospholipid synthase-like methyltransferase